MMLCIVLCSGFLYSNCAKNKRATAASRASPQVSDVIPPIRAGQSRFRRVCARRRVRPCDSRAGSMCDCSSGNGGQNGSSSLFAVQLGAWPCSATCQPQSSQRPGPVMSGAVGAVSLDMGVMFVISVTSSSSDITLIPDRTEGYWVPLHGVNTPRPLLAMRPDSVSRCR